MATTHVSFLLTISCALFLLTATVAHAGGGDGSGGDTDAASSLGFAADDGFYGNNTQGTVGTSDAEAGMGLGGGFGTAPSTPTAAVPTVPPVVVPPVVPPVVVPPVVPPVVPTVPTGVFSFPQTDVNGVPTGNTISVMADGTGVVSDPEGNTIGTLSSAQVSVSYGLAPTVSTVPTTEYVSMPEGYQVSVDPETGYVSVTDPSGVAVGSFSPTSAVSIGIAGALGTDGLSPVGPSSGNSNNSGLEGSSGTNGLDGSAGNDSLGGNTSSGMSDSVGFSGSASMGGGSGTSGGNDGPSGPGAGVDGNSSSNPDTWWGTLGNAVSNMSSGLQDTWAAIFNTITRKPRTEAVPTGQPIPVNPGSCPMDVKQCPDGSYVGRTPPACVFADCPATEFSEDDPNPITCPADVKICPDGSTVGRTAPLCQFAACPLSETKETVDENDITFEVTTMNVDGTTSIDWTTDDVTVQSGQQLGFRWDASSYGRCLLFLNDSGMYTYTVAAPGHGSNMLTGNTVTERYNVPERTGAYRIECSEQSNGEGPTDEQSINVLASPRATGLPVNPSSNGLQGVWAEWGTSGVPERIPQYGTMQ